jgi:hypothetical protein
MRTYMCLEAHEVKNTNLVIQHLLKCCVYIFCYYYYYFRALRRAFFFCEVSISKIKGQVWDLHKLGKCVFFFVGNLKFIRVSNWVVQRFGISVQTG